MKRLLVLRHGRTEWNASGRFQGQMDPPLDSLGLSQAEAAARHLAGVGIEVIATSDLDRAATTAAALGKATRLPVRPDERLRELHLGPWQGLTRAEVREKFPEAYDAWAGGADFARAIGDIAESYQQVAERAVGCAIDVLKQVSDDGLGVVVTHGGTARALIGRMIDLPEDTWWRMAPLGNCCWSLLIETDRGWRLGEHGVSVQETAELPSASDAEPGMTGF